MTTAVVTPMCHLHQHTLQNLPSVLHVYHSTSSYYISSNRVFVQPHFQSFPWTIQFFDCLQDWRIGRPGNEAIFFQETIQTRLAVCYNWDCQIASNRRGGSRLGGQYWDSPDVGTPPPQTASSMGIPWAGTLHGRHGLVPKHDWILTYIDWSRAVDTP